MLVLCAKHHVLPACSRGSVKCICSQVHWAGMTHTLGRYDRVQGAIFDPSWERPRANGWTRLWRRSCIKQTKKKNHFLGRRRNLKECWVTCDMVYHSRKSGHIVGSQGSFSGERRWWQLPPWSAQCWSPPFTLRSCPHCICSTSFLWVDWKITACLC